MREIIVQSYSGFQAEERPIGFWLDGKKILVVDILRRWIEEGIDVGEGRRRCFLVRGDDGALYHLCYDLGERYWLLRQGS